MALLSLGQFERARSLAADSVRRTEPWPRPHADSLYGQAAVLTADGRFDEAIQVLTRAASDRSVLGGLHGPLMALMIETLFLSGRDLASAADLAVELDQRQPDPRCRSEVAPARALAAHVSHRACTGSCLEVFDELDAAERRGEHHTAKVGRVKAGLLALEHGGIRNVRRAWDAASMAEDAGLVGMLRWWLRRYAVYAGSALRVSAGASVLSRLAARDPDGWRDALLAVLPRASGTERAILLRAVSTHANRTTVEALRTVPGKDIADARRYLQHLQAARLYLRTLGGVQLHRGSWSGPIVPIEKRRVRTLLAILAAHSHTVLTRDMAIDMMWPEADADAAVNNLNQTVFQLRRYIDTTYKGGESPEYVISNSEQVGLHPDLVRTDLDEVRRLAHRLEAAQWAPRQEAARRIVDLAQGEFLADLRYEDWAARLQVNIHGELRERLLPIAVGAATAYETDISLKAAAAVMSLDPYDEAGVLALARCLAQSGRRVAARDLLVTFARRLREEMDEAPSPTLASAAATFGAADLVNLSLTDRIEG